MVTLYSYILKNQAVEMNCVNNLVVADASSNFKGLSYRRLSIKVL